MISLRHVLVTGTGGFLGRHLLRELSHRNIQVTGLTRRANPGMHSVAMDDAPWDPERVAAVIRDIHPDAVFHLAGGNTGTVEQLAILNAGVAETLMQALRLAQSRSVFICCGSAAEYGHAAVENVPTRESAECAPATAYGASKLLQTRAVLAYSAETGNRVVIARISNPIGPGMPRNLALGAFAQQIAALPSHGGVLQTGTLDVARDFIDVDLVARALLSLAQQPDAHGVVNVCSGQPTSLAHLLGMLIAVSGKAVRPELDPARVRAGELRTTCSDPSLLWRLIGKLPDTDYLAVMTRLWQDTQAHLAEERRWSA